MMLRKLKIILIKFVKETLDAAGLWQKWKKKKLVFSITFKLHSPL